MNLGGYGVRSVCCNHLCNRSGAIQSTPPHPREPLKYAKAQELSKFTPIKCVFQIFIWFGAQLCGTFVNMLQHQGSSARVKYRTCIILLQSSLYECDVILKDTQIRHIFTF